MQKEFNSNIKTLNIPNNSKILLAVSGGADSVAMLNLFANSKYKCAVAHCNFHLRDKESNLDEKYVEQLTEKHNFKYFKIDFDTKKYSKENGISIEMAARELRYKWFEKIREENSYNYIATAHHKDDIIETFFINLARGTGIRGLTGIKAVKDKILRPLLFADKREIIEYLNTENIKYRTDSSNSDVKIIRNKLRHEIIPAFQEINNSFNKKILETINYLKQTEQVFDNEADVVKSEIVKTVDKLIYINIKKLLEHKPTKLFLFEILKEYDFNNKQVDDIYQVISKESGKQFFSKTHKLIKDRNQLIIEKNIENKNIEILIYKNDINIQLFDNKNVSVDVVTKIKDYKIKKSKNIAAFDFDKLEFPLTIRNWKKGDYFYPFGMKQKKKLSDFFIDQKISILKKEKIKILTSANKIIWIIGYRTDNRFRITDNTKKIVEFRLI